MQTIRVVSYNIRHARGLDNRVDLNRVAQVLGASKAQLIGLQEVDKHMPRSFFQHQAKTLGRWLRKSWVFVPNLTWGAAQYGNAVLCGWPIVSYQQYLLPSQGEQRGLLETEIALPGGTVSFFCTHLGLNEQERLQQAEEILRIVTRTNRPVILVGDFNDRPDSPVYNLITSVLQDAAGSGEGAATYPAGQPTERIDYVFISPAWQVLASFPMQANASDHLPLAVDLQLCPASEQPTTVKFL
ncbi:hypothetical protein JCM39194_15950 [Desulfotomaculum varum]